MVIALVIGAGGAAQVLAGGGSGINASLTGGDVATAAVLLGLFSLIALGVSAWRIRGLDPVGAVDGAAL